MCAGVVVGPVEVGDTTVASLLPFHLSRGLGIERRFSGRMASMSTVPSHWPFYKKYFTISACA